jgi:hypothetical protein
MRLKLVVASAVLAVFGIVFLGAAAWTRASAADRGPAAADARACPEYGSAPVLGEFQIGAASDYRRYLPAMGKSPELDNDSAPAYVVVYRDDVNVETATAGGIFRTRYHDVVCVVHSDGTTDVYSDVPRTGWQPTPQQ